VMPVGRRRLEMSYKVSQGRMSRTARTERRKDHTLLLVRRMLDMMGTLLLSFSEWVSRKCKLPRDKLANRREERRPEVHVSPVGGRIYHVVCRVDLTCRLCQCYCSGEADLSSGDEWPCHQYIKQRLQDVCHDEALMPGVNGQNLLNYAAALRSNIAFQNTEAAQPDDGQSYQNPQLFSTFPPPRLMPPPYDARQRQRRHHQCSELPTPISRLPAFQYARTAAACSGSEYSTLSSRPGSRHAARLEWCYFRPELSFPLQFRPGQHELRQSLWRPRFGSAGLYGHRGR